MICPILSVSVRRLHDIGYSGAFILLDLVPFASLYLLYLHCIDSEEGTNPYGPSPKYIMPATISNNYNPPGLIPVTPGVQPAVVVVPVAQTPAVQQPIPYPQPNPMVPSPVAPYPQPGPSPMAPYPQPGPSPMDPYPQQAPMVAPPASQYPPVDPYSKPNPMQPSTDPYYNSRDFTGQ